MEKQPPQIPWHPICVTFHDETFPPALIVPDRLFHKHHINQWRPTGLYREEYWQVTGDWR